MVRDIDADWENKMKYEVLGRLITKFKDERTLLEGDMNVYTGILGKQTNIVRAKI